MKVRITLTGSSPLLMHNARMSDPLDKYAKELKEYSSKKRKTEDDHRTMSRIEFRGGLYIHEETVVRPGRAGNPGPFIPGINVLRSLVEGGRINKLGKDVERGLMILTDECPLIYDGPRDIAGLWGDGENSPYVSRMSVKNQAARVMRTRPIFKNWALEAEFEVDLNIMTNLDTVQQIATNAGKLAGIGDYRPSSPHGGTFGRYDAKVEAL
jgi:hypothetical protein